MGGLYSRLKTWGPTDTIIGSDLNAEFDNILTNDTPQMMSGYSANVSQMQTQTSPGTLGSESLATSLAGELERLRFQIAAITGNTYWYSAPIATLVTLNSALAATSLLNSVTSGRTLSTSSQPAFLVPSGSTNSVTLKATTTPFVYKIAGVTYTISADQTISGLTIGGAGAAYQATVNDLNITNGASTNLLGENGSSIPVTAMGASIVVGQLAAFKTANSEYILAKVQSSTQLTQVFRGYFFNSSDALFSRSTVNNGDVLTSVRLTWIFAGTTGLITAYNNPNNPIWSGTAPASPTTGDYWYDQVNNIWKLYNGATWAASNTTLIGMCIINSSSVCVGARSFDFFKGHSDLNTVEIVVDSTTAVRSRYPGSQISVYGTTLQYTDGVINWSTSTNMDSGQTFSASTYYYFYVTEAGNPIISNIAPFDRRADLKGYYHPLNTWRCVGFAFANGSTQFNTANPEIESFFQTDQARSVSAFTASVATYPIPYGIQPNQETIECNAAGGAYGIVLPPPAQWKGRRLIYTKTGSDLNQVTLQAFGTSVLTATANTTVGSTTITALSSTTGLTSGQAYLISGSGILPGTTVTWTSSTTAVLSQAPSVSGTGVSLTFAYVPNVTAVSFPLAGISGNFTTSLNTPGETVELYGDGNQFIEVNRRIPSYWTYSGVTTITATTTAPTKGSPQTDAVYWRREGGDAIIRVEFASTGAGAAGSGDYLFALPAALTADTTNITLYTTVVGAAGRWQTPNIIGEGTAGGSTTDFITVCSLYSSTQFRAFGVTAGAQGAVASGSNTQMSSTNVHYNFLLRVPIVGWKG